MQIFSHTNFKGSTSIVEFVICAKMLILIRTSPLDINIWTDIHGIIELDHVVWTYPYGIYFANTGACTMKSNQ